MEINCGELLKVGIGNKKDKGDKEKLLPKLRWIAFNRMPFCIIINQCLLLNQRMNPKR